MNKEKNIKLSFCIPTYNREKFLKDTLDSILNQIDDSIKEYIEIIISDNNSSDNTSVLVSDYINNFPWIIKYHKNQENIWPIKNVIKVTDYAIWKYIWLLTDDDCITDFALKYVLEIIDNNDFDIIFSRIIQFEKLPVTLEKTENTIKKFSNLEDFIDYIYLNKLSYAQVISFFSYYSLNIIKNSYFQDSKKNIWKLFEDTNFPHTLIIYSNNLSNIIFPDNSLVLWRIMNESYAWNLKLVRDLEDVFLLIENKYNLWKSIQWNSIKSKCLNSWKINIYLWIVLKKLNIDHRNSKILQKVYYFYRKVMGLFFS